MLPGRRGSAAWHVPVSKGSIYELEWVGGGDHSGMPELCVLWAHSVLGSYFSKVRDNCYFLHFLLHPFSSSSSLPSSYHLVIFSFPQPIPVLLFCPFSHLVSSASFNWSKACTWANKDLPEGGLYLQVKWRLLFNWLHREACAGKCFGEPHCQYQHLAFCSSSNSGDLTCPSACL